MSPSFNIVLLALALLKEPATAERLADVEQLKQVDVVEALEDFNKMGYVEEEGEGFVITPDGRKQAWRIVKEDLPSSN
jgi:Mn-dependent DtxR family transcriptional regulator